MALNAQIFIVDPQNDFMGEADGSPYSQAGSFAATLPVAGAVQDMDRLAAMINRVGPKISDIHVTLDSHHPVDVAHPAMWKDSAGNSPPPFQLILSKDIKSGQWTPRNRKLRDYMITYTEALEAGGKFVLIIWPEHCLIGSWGHNVYAPLKVALDDWARAGGTEQIATIGYITKGSNWKTEHYGGLMAEVPDPNDPSTQLNTTIIQALQDADLVAVAGEASSHCVMATVQQIVDNIGDSHLHKLHLIVDCMSPVAAVPGVDFPQIASDFLVKMQSRGLHLTKSTEFLK